MKHAELGASGAHRWMKCAGSINASRGVPDVRTEYAEEGIAAHALAERCLTKGVDADAFIGVMLEIPVETDVTGYGDYKADVLKWTVDEDMAEDVQVYVDFVRSMFKGADVTYVEKQFDLSPLNPPGPMFGTSDAVAWFEEESLLDIADLKYGYMVVDVDENEQLLMYLLGAVVALHVKPKRLRMTIVQPRAGHPDGIIRRTEVTWEGLVAFKKELFARARATLDPAAPRVIGEHCKFCRALPRCPEQHENALTVAQDEFQAIPEPDQLTEEQLLFVLEKASLVEAWFNSIRSYVRARIESGEEMTGWKLVDKRATRKWVNEDQAVEWATEKGVSEPYQKQVKTPAQMEAELKKLLPRGKKKTAKEMLENSGLVEAKSSGFNLVPASDPRPPAQITAAEDEFAALPAADSDN